MKEDLSAELLTRSRTELSASFCELGAVTYAFSASMVSLWVKTGGGPAFGAVVPVLSWPRSVSLL